MGDWYQNLVESPVGKRVISTVGMPSPARLRRYSPGAPLVEGPILFGSSLGGRLAEPVNRVLEDAGVELRTVVPQSEGGERFGALIFDATGIAGGSRLRDVFEFFSPTIRMMAHSSRLIVFGGVPAKGEAGFVAAQRALEGFVRSAGKEMRNGSTANLIRVDDGAEGSIDSTLRFFLSGRSAFVSGQCVTLSATSSTTEGPMGSIDWERPLEGQVALVTGAAQGIGAAIAEVLGREGADVVCLDVPAQGQALTDTANRVGGRTLQLDITSDDASSRLVEYLDSHYGGIDVVVHNAGITRDKALAGMDAGRWDQVIAVNLTSQERINEMLLGKDVLRPLGRIISISSVSGIAGNRGQTNYAVSKAGVIGMVEGLAPELSARRGSINAVAPGFIETAMTARMPFVLREAGRRMNSLNQGGLPIDVGEAVGWLANPASIAVNGNVVRVCGQSLIGA